MKSVAHHNSRINFKIPPPVTQILVSGMKAERTPGTAKDGNGDGVNRLHLNYSTLKRVYCGM